MREPVAQLVGVDKVYAGSAPVQALRCVDLDVFKGDLISIVGTSGSGKSTLLNIVGLLDRPSSGTFLLHGSDTSKLSERELSRLRGREIGFVFQGFHLVEYKTCLENVAMSMLYQGRRPDLERAAAALDDVGLSEKADRFPAELSGGQRQRVAIARAIAGDPSILLCDEPTGNLDSRTTAEVFEMLLELNSQGMTSVIITHDQKLAELARRRFRIEDGRMAALPDRTPVGLDA